MKSPTIPVRTIRMGAIENNVKYASAAPRRPALSDDQSLYACASREPTCRGRIVNSTRNCRGPPYARWRTTSVDEVGVSNMMHASSHEAHVQVSVQVGHHRPRPCGRPRQNAEGSLRSSDRGLDSSP